MDKQSQALITGIGETLKKLREEFTARLDGLNQAKPEPHEVEEIRLLALSVETSVEALAAEVARLEDALPEAQTSVRVQVESAMSTLHAALDRELRAVREDRVSTTEDLNLLVGRINQVVPSVHRLHQDMDEIREAMAVRKQVQQRTLRKVAERVDETYRRIQDTERSLTGYVPLEAMQKLQHSLVERIETLTHTLASHEDLEPLRERLEGLSASITTTREALSDFEERLKEIPEGNELPLTEVVVHDELNERLQDLRGEINTISELMLESVSVEKVNGLIDSKLSEAGDLSRTVVEEMEQRLGSRIDGLGEQVQVEAEVRVEGQAKLAQATAAQYQQTEDTLSQQQHDLDSINATVGDLKQRLAEDIQKLDERMAELRDTELREIIDQRHQELGEQLALMREQHKALESEHGTTALRTEEIQASVEHEMQTLVRRVVSEYSRIEDWKQGGAAYKQCAFVKHLGGVWQAMGDTKAEPGVGEDWLLVMGGMKSASLQGTEIAGEVEVSMQLTRGDVISTRIQLPPFVRFLKDDQGRSAIWQKDMTYTPGDSPMWKRCRWVFLGPDSDEEPGTGDSWALMSMAGARGQKGEKGERGEQGPIYPMERILTEVMAATDRGEGAPLRQYRGGWLYGERYARGDVVRMDRSLWIAVRDNDGTSGPLMANASDDWALMLDAQGGGGGGGGGGGTLKDVWDDGVPATSGDSIIDFVGTGDTSISVTQGVSPDRTVVTINSVPGGGGGGVGKGDPWVIGDIVLAETDAGAGTVETSGISGAALGTHLGDGDIHFADVPDSTPSVRVNGAWQPETGEANISRNDGGGINIGKAKEGVTLPLRTLSNGQFELAGDVVSVQATAFETAGAVAVHIADSGDPHAAAGYLKDAAGSIGNDGELHARRNGAWEAFELAQGATYRWSASTSMTFPGVGFVRINSPNVALATEMAVADVGRDGFDNKAFVNGQRVGSLIAVRDDFDVDRSAIYEVSSDVVVETGYTRIPIQYISDQGGGTPVNNEPIHLLGSLGSGAGADFGETNTASNQGSGAQLVLAKDNFDLPFRTLVSGDSSISISQLANTLDLRAVGGGGGGTYNEVTKDGSSISVGQSILEFRDTGDATVTVQDDAGNNRTIITIDATAGGGGGGVGAGTPFDENQLAVVSSAAGDGEINTTGIVAADVVVKSGTPADDQLAIFTGPNGVEGVPALTFVGTTFNVVGDITLTGTVDGRDVLADGAAQDAHIADATIHFTEASIDHNAIANLTVGNPHPQYLQEVLDDPSPQLGGDLDTNGSNIVLARDDTSVRGLVVAAEAVDGAALIYTQDPLVIDLNDGSAVVKPGRITLNGTSIDVSGLKHTVDGGRQVYVAEDGTLYGVDPPPTGWFVDDSDTGNYNLGAGDSTGPWVEIAGISLILPEDVAQDQVLTVSANLWVVLGDDGDVSSPMDKASSVNFGFGIDGATPGTVRHSAALSPYFNGPVVFSFQFAAAAAYTAGQEISLFAQRGPGDDSDCNPFVQYSSPGGVVPHTATLSTPGAGGGGGSGDVTGPASSGDGNLAVFNGTSGKVIQDGGPVPTTVIMTGRDTYAISGTVSDGDLLEFFVDEDTTGPGEVVEVIGVTAKLGAGTCSITVDVNGTPVPGLDGPIAVTTTPAKTSATGNGVRPGGPTIPVNVVVSGASGASDLSVTIFTRHTCTLS